MSFHRTKAGLIAKYKFYSKPLVWVEGKEDINFFLPLTNHLNYNFALESASGKPQCLKLIKGLQEGDHPYVVIIDGDYDVLEGEKNHHSRAIVLQRYSHENYLFEKNSINRLCKQLACTQDQILTAKKLEDIVSQLSKLKKLVKLDLANHLSDTESVWPDNTERLLQDRSPPTLDEESIKNTVDEYDGEISEETFKEANQLLETYLEGRRFVDILKGHFLFHIIYDLIIYLVRDQGENLTTVDKKTLRALLSEKTWNSVETEDHKILKEQLCKAVENCEKRL